MARIRLSMPDSGLGFQANVVRSLEGVPSSLGSSMRVVKRERVWQT